METIEPRTCKASVKLFEESQELSFKTTLFTQPATVLVFDDGNRVVGAVESREHLDDRSVIIFHLVFDFATPERLDVENQQPLYATPIGEYRVGSAWDKLHEEPGQKLVTQVYLNGIRLSPRPVSFMSRPVELA